MYLSWTSFTSVTLAERLKIPSISKPKENKRERETISPVHPVIGDSGSRFYHWRRIVTLFCQKANGVSHHHGNAVVIWTPLSEPDTKSVWEHKLRPNLFSCLCIYHGDVSEQDLQLERHPEHLVGERRAAGRRHGSLCRRFHGGSQLVVIPDGRHSVVLSTATDFHITDSGNDATEHLNKGL